MTKIRFVAQAWINNYAVECDPEGPTTFLVPDSDVTAKMHDDAGARDDLRAHDNAPEWVREWSGPFECEIVYECDYCEDQGSVDKDGNAPGPFACPECKEVARG
jgi:hypothetical protein